MELKVVEQKIATKRIFYVLEAKKLCPYSTFERLLALPFNVFKPS
jgi:hypothetical protein